MQSGRGCSFIRLEADVANRSNFQWEKNRNCTDLPKTSSVATMFFNRKAHMATVLTFQTLSKLAWHHWDSFSSPRNFPLTCSVSFSLPLRAFPVDAEARRRRKEVGFSFTLHYPPHALPRFSSVGNFCSLIAIRRGNARGFFHRTRRSGFFNFFLHSAWSPILCLNQGSDFFLTTFCFLYGKIP